MAHCTLLIALFAVARAQAATYYISKSQGSDTNTSTQAQSKQFPWAHLPGMPSCTANCASYTPQPGDSFILRGGDTWVASDLDVWWQWTGTSSSPIYIGVDQTWYSGSSWTRPVWTCGGATCSYTANGNGFYSDWSGVQYVTVDNIEVTGLYWNSSSSPNYFSIYGSNNTFEHIYAHGWSHASFASGTTEGPAVFGASTCCGGGLNNVIHDNVIDGTDTDQQSMTAFFGTGNHDVHNNVVKYVSNGLEGGADIVYNNWFGPMNVSFAPGAHQNAIQQQGPVDGTNVFIYNNVITQVASGGIVKIWTMQSAVNNGALNSYVFNNVEFNNSPGNDVDICQEGTNCGTHYFFNNTFECGNDANTDICSAPGGGGPTTVVYWTNNHCITSDVCFKNLGTNVTATLTTNLTQTVSAAGAQGYNDTAESFPFFPANSSGSTVGAGTNEQSLCNTMAALNSAAGAACMNGTGYACTYNASNHTVTCPAKTAVARPSSSAWDVGAYQFSGSGGDTTPPTIAINSPANNATVSGAVTISGTASDNVSVSSVAVSVDGGAYSLAIGTASWTFSLNTTSLTNAAHTITAKAWDPSNSTGTASISVTVSNGSGHIYYISKSLGSDSNTSTQAESKMTPWAHLPGMPSCTANCASYTPQPGDRFILYGGDTWTGSDLGVNWQWSGTSGSPIYVGVDPTWYVGSSWVRPIFNCGNTQCSTTLGGSYVSFDNIEITGFRQTASSGNPAVIQTSGNYVEVEHIYIHNFTNATTSTHSNAIANQCCGNGSAGTYIHDNVIDGSDSEQDFMGGILHGHEVANNIIRYVYNGLNGTFDDVHGNLIENNYASADGDHCNMAFIQGPFSASQILVYDNVIRNVTCDGGVTLWLGGLSCSSYNGYAFNNVIYNTQTGNIINPPGQVGGCGTLRTWDVFNNTVECGSDSSTGTCYSDSGDVGQADNAVMNFINDHWITSANPLSCEVTTCNNTTDLTQTVSAANGQGYTSSQTYAFSPMSGSDSTVGAGTNEQSLCNTIATLNATAGAACQSDTGYACTYNTTNHTVTCPAQSLVAHPTTSGAWDIGAYEYAGGGSSGTPPSVPTNLTATAVSPSQINLSWTASTDPGGPGVAGYDVYRNGVWISSVTSGVIYSDSGRSPSTTYSYTVTAYDTVGDVSAPSASASATTQAAQAACHVVTPTGSGNQSGSDWNNAYAGLPAALVRGDVYYLADGTYGSYTFNTPDSGTSLVTIRKAIASDHCTDTGWNTSTMGLSQAVFTRNISLYTDYLTVDGNGSQTGPGCGGAPGATVTSSPPNPADCGIAINNGCSSSTGDACDSEIYLSNPNTETGVTGYTFRYVEVIGNGDNNSDRMEIWGPFGGTGDGGTFTHIYGHNAGCVYFQDGGDGRNVSSSYFWGTEVNGGSVCHGQYSFYANNDSNGVEHDNVYRDITGTAIWTFALGSGTHTGWQFYDNVIYNSTPTASWTPYLSDGTLACINSGVNCETFTLAQNTIININNPGINNENTGSYIVENNLYYDNPNPPSFNVGTGGSYTQNHNSCLNSGTCPSGTANVTDESAPNPFTNWTGGTFALASENPDWNNRASLGASYNTDAAGNAFTSDRGAYQYCPPGQCAPPPLSIQTTSLPGGTVGTAYSQTLSASGGIPPYNWSVISGTLVPGLNLTSVTGVINGTPSAAGAFNFTVQVQDSATPIADTATVALAITVNTAGSPPPPPSGPTTLPVINPNDLPNSVGINDSLSITNYPDSNVSFVWSFGPVTPNNSNAAPSVIARGAGTASFSSGVKTASLASYGLVPGIYQVTVQAQDAHGDTSPPLTTTITLVNADLSAVKVYPNPWRSDKHAGKSVTFAGLTTGTTIKIFSVSGHKVKELNTDGPSTTWDLTNDSGDRVGSGIYLYVITDGQGDKVRGKVAVIK